MDQPTITLNPQQFQILHRLIALGLDQLPDEECTEEVLNEVAKFSGIAITYEGYDFHPDYALTAR